MSPKKMINLSPGRIILVSLLATISIGTILLMLPASRIVPIPVVDLFFTATSMTCVTGLLTVPLSSFTPIGQMILLVLMQIGGLGLITLTIFLMSLFVDLGFGTQLLAGKMLELESWKNIRKLILFIITITMIMESIGAVLTFIAIKEDFILKKALFYSAFHAVSSFCDAGFSLFPRGMYPYSNNALMLITTSVLMLFGGLGFITWHEIVENVKTIRSKKRLFFLSTPK